jgi:hypothetical protein
MKKELLMASALVSTMGVASVAEAVTATTSGSHHTGLRGTSLDTGAADTIAQVVASSFSVSLSETTDGGVGIASSFMLANEGTTGTQSAGLTLKFGMTTTSVLGDRRLSSFAFTLSARSSLSTVTASAQRYDSRSRR